jgi:transcriptional regulator with XRE-family HTH domain
MTTGSIIRQLRKENRLSQTELAKQLHVSQATVTAWETGRSDPSISALNAIADYFNVSTDYLAGRTTIRKENDSKLTKNQKLVAYSIDPDISDEEREAIIQMVEAAKKFKRRI